MEKTNQDIQTIEDWNEIKYFESSDFDSPDEPGSGKKMNKKVIIILEAMREHLGLPLIVNSGFRTPAHNAQVGGKKDSAHLSGLAADIRVLSPGTRFKILNYLLWVGLTRIGIGQTYIHFDIDEKKPQRVVWLY